MTQALDRDRILAAAGRLRGHLVAAPVVGDLLLPGSPLPSDLRLKLELLQPGGSMFFRGALHWLTVQLGRHKALRHVGSGALARAWASAARSTRSALTIVPSSPLDQADRAWFAACGCRVQSADEAGAVATPPVDDVDFAAGVATVLLELRDELPADTRRLVVAPGGLAQSLQLGVHALGLPWQVEAPASPSVPPTLIADVLSYLRLRSDGLAALAHAAARGDDGVCVLLGE